MFVTNGRELFEFVERIERAILGRHSDVEHARSHHVFVGLVAIEIGDVVVHLISRKFATGVRQGEDLVTAMLDGTTFVHIDVCTLGC